LRENNLKFNLKLRRPLFFKDVNEMKYMLINMMKIGDIIQFIALMVNLKSWADIRDVN